MARIVKFFKVLQNNWKKTTVLTAVIGYGIDYAGTEFEKKSLVKRYCLEAVKYGYVTLEASKYPRHVVVILNPAANKKKAQKEYEKYCAPLLHLAGICVTVLTTNKNVDSIDIVSRIPANADAVLIAGGDGMVSEVVTGLLRLKNDQSRESVLPIGILPVGRTNTLAKDLYSFGEDSADKLYRVYLMMEATFSIIRELTRTLNVMEIKNIDSTHETEIKPVYALNRLEFGVFRDARALRDKYWYFGSFRTHAPYVFGTFDRDAPVKANVRYTPPCSGCAKCYLNRSDLTKRREEVKNRRWWHPFVPTFRRNLDSSGKPTIDYAKITNPNCGNENEISVNTVDLSISQRVIDNVPGLHVAIGPENLGFLDFVKEGWRRETAGSEGSIHLREFDAQNVYLTPLDEKMDDKFFFIDNEDFEIKKISVSLLHNVISVFQSSRSLTPLRS